MSRKEPIANAWTNAAYLLVGLYAVLDSGEAGIPLLVTSGILTVGSAGFHTFEDKFWQRLDEFGMYAVMSALVSLTTGLTFWAMIPVLIGLAFFLNRIDSMIALGGFGGLVLGGMVANELYIWAASAVMLFVGSFAVRQVDNPVGHGPLHALWHVGTAAMFLVIYLSVHG